MLNFFFFGRGAVSTSARPQETLTACRRSQGRRLLQEQKPPRWPLQGGASSSGLRPRPGRRREQRPCSFQKPAGNCWSVRLRRWHPLCEYPCVCSVHLWAGVAKGAAGRPGRSYRWSGEVRWCCLTQEAGSSLPSRGAHSLHHRLCLLSVSLFLPHPLRCVCWAQVRSVK